MSQPPTYIQGADDPALQITWKSDAGSIIDFSSGYTFTLKVGIPGSAALLTKTTGIAGAAAAPNVTITWATSGELNTLTPGTYTCQLTATASSRQRIITFDLIVRPAIS